MKKYEVITAIIIMLLLFACMIYAISVNLRYRHTIPTTNYIVDTVYVNNINEKLMEDYVSLMAENDSLMVINDSLILVNAEYKDRLDISLFKLERIKEYNKIAGNKNNIKFLRGWINRVLED